MFGLFLMGISFSACQKEEGLSPAQNADLTKQGRAENSDFKFRFNGEYLEFAHQKDFDALVKFLEPKNEAELNEWAESLPQGFVSLRKLYQQAQAAEMENAKVLVRKSKLELQALQQQNKFMSIFTKQNAESFVFEDGTFSMNVFKREFGAIINKEGLVSISGNILQFTNEYVKVLSGKQKQNKAKLKKATADQLSDGIMVRPVFKMKNDGKGNGRDEFYKNHYVQTIPNEYRIRWSVSLYKYSNPTYNYDDADYQACIYEAAVLSIPENEHCSPPISSWNNTSSYFCEAWHERNELLWWWVVQEAVPMEFIVTATINGQYREFSTPKFPVNHVYAGYHYYNLHNGSYINVTNANHIFRWYALTYYGNFGWIPQNITFE